MELVLLNSNSKKCGGEKKAEIVAIEPYIDAIQFMSEKVDFRKKFFPNVVKEEKFDFVYASTIDNCFNEHEYNHFLQSLYNCVVHLNH